jgi:hypothetical protein
MPDAGLGEAGLVLGSTMTALGFAIGSQNFKNPQLRRVCQIGSIATMAAPVGMCVYYSSFPKNPTLIVAKALQVAASEHFFGRPPRHTPERIQQGMRASGTIGSSTIVKKVTGADRVGEGSGFTSELFPLHIEYEGPEGPRVVICKTDPPGFQNVGIRVTSRLLGLYANECNFYNFKIAEMCGWDTPVVYHADHDKATEGCTILMEDLGQYPDSYFGDQVAGATLQEANIALREISKLHIRFWNSVRRESPAGFEAWKPLEDGTLDITFEIIGRRAAFKRAKAVYKEYGWTSLTKDRSDAIELYMENAMKLCMRRKPKEIGGNMTTTLCHADYRMENLFFCSADGGELKVKVFDFQTVQEQNPCRDLGYFVIMNMTTEMRRKHEVDLLLYYHQQMAKGGVDYPWLEMLSDYQNFVGFLNVTMMSMLANVNWSTMTTDQASQKAIRLWSSMAQRLVVAVDDWNLREYIDLALTLHPSDDRSQLWRVIPAHFREAGPASLVVASPSSRL